MIYFLHKLVRRATGLDALGGGCGKERWDVKTLTDAAAGQVNLTPVTSTVAQLIALPAPSQPTARVPQEQVVYELTGTITLAKQEADSDIHMVLDDGQGHTMICEAIAPSCAAGSRVLDQLTTARQLVEQQFPTAAQGGIETNLTVPVTVTGVLFFDRLHGQSGVAPNGVELHPLLSFSTRSPS